MKKIYRDRILNIEGTDIFDNTFLFGYIIPLSPNISPGEGSITFEKDILPQPQKQPLPQPLSRRGEQEVFQNNLSQVNHRLPYNKDLSERRKELKQNLTVYEKIAWNNFLFPIQKEYGVRILQQRIIGNFIVDFYISSLNLVIEIDGESHFNEQGKEYDRERTEILEGLGLIVIRYTNSELKNNIENIKEEFISTYIAKKTPLSWRGVGGEVLSQEDTYKNSGVETIYLRNLLQPHKNEEILLRVGEKPAMYSEVYSPKDELEIFTELFETAIKENKKIHIVGVTLGEEIQMLEKYYEELGFLREDINAFDVDFSVPLVTVSCHIENLMWKGSDYKAQRENIFFCPPIRESGQNKALFKGITRGVTAGIDFSHAFFQPSFQNTLPQPLSMRGELDQVYQDFLGDCIRQEKILPLQMGRVLKYNLDEVGIEGEVGELKVGY